MNKSHRSDSVLPNELKFVVLGSAAVGKSSITLRFLNDEFTEDYNPTLQESYRKNLSIDNNMISLEILDTAGYEEYEMLQDSVISDGTGFILIYSIEKEETFQYVKTIKKRIERIKNFIQVPAILVGNKCDRPNRVVSYEQGSKLAAELNMLFLETSAKTGMHCQDVFMNLAKEIVKKEIPQQDPEKKSFFDNLFGSCNLI